MLLTDGLTSSGKRGATTALPCNSHFYGLTPSLEDLKLPPVPAQLPQQEGRRSHVCPGSHNQLACTPTALPVTQTCRAMSEAARLPPLLAVSRLSLPTHQDTDRVTLCLPRSPTQAGHPSLMLACPMRIWVNSRISMPRETIWKVQSGGETGSL